MTAPSVQNPADSHTSRRSAWVVGAALLLVTAAVFALTSARSTISMDVWSGNLASWRIATAGTPWLDGVSVPQLDDHPAKDIWVMQAENGHRAIGRSPGVIAAGVPAYWIFQPDSMTALPGGITAAVLSALASLFVFLALRQHLATREAALAAGLLAFTTPVWSVAANGIWPHTLTVFGITGMAWAASKERWWLVGLFGGVALWGRLHVALIVAIVGLAAAFIRRRPQIAVVVGAISTGFLGLVCLWCHWMYGSWSPMSSYDTTLFEDYASENRFSVTNQLGMWFSPDRGIFIWTPLLLLLTPALIRGWRDLPDWSRSLLLGGLAYTVLQASLNRFSGGDSFYGYRLGLEFLACATPAYALAAVRMGRWAKRLFAPVAAVQLCLIVTGAVQDGYYISAERVWEDNAFLKAWRDNPPALSLVVVACVAAGILAQRIWADPGLEKRPAKARD